MTKDPQYLNAYMYKAFLQYVFKINTVKSLKERTEILFNNTKRVSNMVTCIMHTIVKGTQVLL